MNRYSIVLAALLTGFGLLLGYAGAQENPVTAINITLEPDATMIQHAEAANALLRQDFPTGYALDATHRPHITMLQRFVRTADLDELYAVVDDVLDGQKTAGLTLKAVKYDYVISDKVGVTAILIERTDELVKLQQRLIDAVAPFAVKTGTVDAFFTTPDDPDINQHTVDDVTRYVPDSTGTKFNPHLTVGVAPPDDLKKMVAEPFEAFTFTPTALSVYQLGNFGTARKKLEAWELKP